MVVFPRKDHGQSRKPRHSPQDLIRRRLLSATLWPVIVAGGIVLRVYFGAVLHLTATSRDTLIAHVDGVTALRHR